MKAKKLLALVLALAMVVALFPAVYAAEAETDPLSFADAKVTELTPKVDGETLKVTKYEDVYCATPNSAEQQLAVFVPENATANSPIIYMVDNSGWRSDAYATVKDTVASYGWVKQTNSWTGETKDVLVGDYKSGTDTDAVGECLANGYIIVVAGLRSRADAPTDGEYLGHSPATMTDAKAVIRYLKYNDAVIPGSSDFIVITGTSGGGALSVITAASGNAADYYESLYEIGAAGIVKNADGSYTDTLSDDIFATIAYCPITDLGNACAAYDWQWGDARAAMMAAGELSYKGASAEQVNANAAALTAIYEEYLDSLGLESVSAANLESTIIALMEAEIAEAIKEVGVEQMKADLGEATWLTFNEDGTFVYDYDAHVLWVAHQTNLKISPAFSNVGTGYGEFMNEDNLFGARDQEYAPFNEYSWSIDATENEVGLDSTGLTWDEYMATEEGAALALQIKMTNPIPYLLSEEGDSAPNWYVRYGMADRDSSFAVEAVLNAALDAAEDVEDKTFEYAWLKPHSGNYDVQEAYTWLAEQLAEEVDALSAEDAKLTTLTAKLDGEDFNVYMLEDCYLASPNREQDQLVSVYVPENATADSPIILYVNNSGWQSNSYSGRNQVYGYGWVEQTKKGQTTMVLVGDYKSDSDTDMIGRALSDGYVIVSYGCRSRNNGATDGEYLGHSPATMTDTKAVVRWLRYNADLLPAGDPEKIVVTGTSGGGALSVVIAASGDSADYYESLYEVGAAGIELVDGKYVSTISDSVWGTIAYCPITDLGNACAAYEWTWGDARAQQMAAGEIEYGVPADVQNAASAELKALYEDYVDGLAIDVNSDNLKDTIIALMKAEIEESIKEVGIEQMRKDLGDADWLVINDDGTYTYDYEKHVYATGLKSTFKAASAFSNTGMSAWKGERNEDNLFGTTSQDYAPFNEYAWNHDDTDNEVGLDDTGLTWDEYILTEEGQGLLKQIKMTSPIQYLLGDESEVNTAPHWYVRYGMYDRDSSWAVETVLYYSILESADVDCVNFEFAWLKGHQGNYDVQEAYNWLANELDAFSVKGAEETNTFDITVDGETVSITRYNDYYYSAGEGDTTTVGPGMYGPKGDRDDCQLSIYVPEGATADSAVMFLIENGSWAQTGFKEVIAAGDSFDSTQNDRIALALAHDMIVVSYGARCRGSVDAEGNAVHSPQMVVDTKAAIRYVKYNIEQGLIPGDADKVIVSGHSGGGAMSAIIAATGNSSDYEAYLKNAAPATDDVYAVMASAPITDLAYADFAYEWTFSDYRAEAPYDSLSYKTYDADLSATLAARYVPYIEDNFGMTEEEYTAKIAEIFAASVQHEIDLAGLYQYSDIRPETDDRGLFELDENGDVVSFDLEAYTEWAVQNAGITAAYNGNELKGVMAFNSQGMTGGYSRNENNLWGAADQKYAVAYEELWVLADDTAKGGYETWDEYWAAMGETVGMQMKMVSVMPYLTGSENMWYLEGLDDSGDESDVAPYWFIRHGMGDIDTSYATVVSLMLAVEENAEHVNAYFGWERGHNKGGSTYYLEFFKWLEDEGVIEAKGFEDVKAGDWFADSVETVVEEGLMNGVGNNQFNPYGTASRAMIVTVLYRLAGSPAVEAEAQFTDLTADWYKDAVAWAVANGITKGTSETTFEPDKAVTRQELATFLYRFSGAEKVEADLSKYADADQIADWALEAMAWANAEGIITGKSDTTLAPAATSNRAELATILARYIAK